MLQETPAANATNGLHCTAVQPLLVVPKPLTKEHLYTTPHPVKTQQICIIQKSDPE
jgi:hypothetical protein